jgi:hypothetical protein
MKLIIDIPKSKLLQVLVPDNIEKCEIVNYGYAGTWLMESNSKNLNAWKMKLPNGKYEVIGRVNDVVADIDLSEIEINKNFIIRCL